MIRESMRAEVQFPEGPFRGVSEQGERQACGRRDRGELIPRRRWDDTSENVCEISTTTGSECETRCERGNVTSRKPVVNLEALKPPHIIDPFAFGGMAVVVFTSSIQRWGFDSRHRQSHSRARPTSFAIVTGR